MPRLAPLALLLLVVAYASPIVPARGPTDAAIERVYDETGHLLLEIGIEPSNPDVAFVRHHTYAVSSTVTDCPSKAYRLGGWKWTGPYSAFASSYAEILDASAATWDAETGAAISGGISAGSHGVAGTYDGVNQMDWAPLGASSTIAVTTTWYYRGSGLAVESDAQYNTAYPWSTTGDAGAMDVANIATHEIGHTFGLDHPKGKAVSCLTMYAYGSLGETQKRTLGTGDILGIRALYGS